MNILKKPTSSSPTNSAKLDRKTDSSENSASSVSSRLQTARVVQNFHLVWLDRSTEEDNDKNCRNSISKMREVVNTECIR